MDREGVVVRQTGVGDRYVLEDMKSGGFSLGGEPVSYTHLTLPTSDLV